MIVSVFPNRYNEKSISTAIGVITKLIEFGCAVYCSQEYKNDFKALNICYGKESEIIENPILSLQSEATVQCCLL